MSDIPSVENEKVVKLRGPIRLTSSKRKLFSQCPKKYYLTYIRKLWPFVVSGPIAVGKAADEALETALLTGDEPDLNKLRDAIEAGYPSYQHTTKLLDGVQAAYEYAVSRTGLKVVQGEFGVNKLLQPCKVDYRSSTLFDAAKPDLMTLVSDDLIYIDDWKAGHPGYPDLNQLEDYALHAFCHLPLLRKAVCRLVWLRDGRKKTDTGLHVTEIEVTRDEIPKIVHRWSQSLAEISKCESGGNWPATANAMCQSCDYYHQCPEQQI